MSYDDPNRRRRRRPQSPEIPMQPPAGPVPPDDSPFVTIIPAQLDSESSVPALPPGSTDDRADTSGSDLAPYEPPPQETARSKIQVGDHRVVRPEEIFKRWDYIYQRISDAFVDTSRGFKGGAEALREPENYHKLISKLIQDDPKLEVNTVDTNKLVELMRVYQFGYKNLESFMHIEGLEEIYFNRFDQGFYITSRGKFKIVDPVFKNQQELRDFIDHVARENGLEINDQKPAVDATLRDGSRLNAVLSPPAYDGPDVSIRKHREIPFTIDQYIATEMVTPELVEFFQDKTLRGYNIVVSGGTSSGKTTFLNTIGNAMIPHTARVLILENNKELQIYTDDTKYYQTRQDAMREGGANEIQVKDLIRQTLRKNPDRIIVGELRGSEAYYAMRAWSSGHGGSFCTIHSDSPFGAIYTLQQLAGAAREMDRPGVIQLIASSVDVIVQIKQSPLTGKRQVVAVAQVLHPYKYDIFDEEVHSKVARLGREQGMVRMYEDLFVYTLFKLNSSGLLVKVNDPIPIEGKDV